MHYTVHCTVHYLQDPGPRGTAVAPPEEGDAEAQAEREAVC